MTVRERKVKVTFHVHDGDPFVVTARLPVTKPTVPGGPVHVLGRVELHADREALVYGYSVECGSRRSTGFQEFDDRTPIRLLPGDTLGLTLHAATARTA